jgi:proteasome assembly chaperone (PAC2) family protein
MAEIDTDAIKYLYGAMNEQKVTKMKDILAAATNSKLNKDVIDQIIRNMAEGGGGCGIGCC